LALGTALAGGAIVHSAGQQRLQANGPGFGRTVESAAPSTSVDRLPSSGAPAPISAASTAVSGAPLLIDDPVPEPSADERAPSVEPRRAADGGPEKVKKARRRSLRGLPQSVRRAPPAAASSLADDDELWDRRH
jgi:hypothetical protein